MKWIEILMAVVFLAAVLAGFIVSVALNFKAIMALVIPVTTVVVLAIVICRGLKRLFGTEEEWDE